MVETGLLLFLLNVNIMNDIDIVLLFQTLRISFSILFVIILVIIIFHIRWTGG